MAEEAARSRLGRGLAALIGEVGEEVAVLDRVRGQRRVPIEFLRRNPRNPRRAFGDADLDELANSIRERGIIQPILVRILPGLADVYEIIAGERRWRAAQRAGLHDLPVIVVEADHRASLEIAIIENVQRTDLNAIEEAFGYGQLMAEFHYSQGDLAQIIGKSRSHVANTLRLMKLPEEVKALVADGTLSAGHARALLAVDEPLAVAKRIVDKGLTVRDVERIAQQQGPGENRAKAEETPAKDADTRALERELEEALGLKVSISHGPGGGELRIRYKSLDQLDGVCRRLRNEGTRVV